MNFTDRPSVHGSAAEEIRIRLRTITPLERANALIAQHADESIRSAILWAAWENTGDYQNPALAGVYATEAEARRALEKRIRATCAELEMKRPTLSWVAATDDTPATPIVNGQVHPSFAVKPMKVDRA